MKEFKGFNYKLLQNGVYGECLNYVKDDLQLSGNVAFSKCAVVSFFLLSKTVTMHLDEICISKEYELLQSIYILFTCTSPELNSKYKRDSWNFAHQPYILSVLNNQHILI